MPSTPALGDRGRIANIREDNCTVGHLFAAAFRAMAGNYAICADRLSPGRDWQRIVFSGGLAKRFARLAAKSSPGSTTRNTVFVPRRRTPCWDS